MQNITGQYYSTLCFPMIHNFYNPCNYTGYPFTTLNNQYFSLSYNDAVRYGNNGYGTAFPGKIYRSTLISPEINQKCSEPGCNNRAEIQTDEYELGGVF